MCAHRVLSKSIYRESKMEKEQFKKALEERLQKRLKKETFDEITVGGSKMRFDMAMAITGYPFELPKGASEEDYSPLLTDQQYFPKIMRASLTYFGDWVNT